MKEKSFELNDAFLEEYLEPFLSKRGCAWIGSSDFDKLQAVKQYLEKKGHDNFVIIDCNGKLLDDGTLYALLHQYADTDYVIFTNCENILQDTEVLRSFVHLVDSNEYASEFNTSSFYVFLSETNTLPKRSQFPTASVEMDYIDSFCTFIHCYDFDTKSIYFG